MSEHTCGECEYFDIGAMSTNGHSDCLNNRSPRFQTYNISPACPVFLPDTTDQTDE